jgi:hypothetical protein
VANGKCVNRFVAALNIAVAYLPYLPYKINEIFEVTNYIKMLFSK